MNTQILEQLKKEISLQYIGEQEEKPQTVHLSDVLETSKKTSGTHQS